MIEVAESQQVSEMTRAELKAMIKALVQEAVQDAMQEMLWTLEQYLPDPDEGLELRPEVAAYLREVQEKQPHGRSLDKIVSELGLDE